MRGTKVKLLRKLHVLTIRNGSKQEWRLLKKMNRNAKPSDILDLLKIMMARNAAAT